MTQYTDNISVEKLLTYGSRVASVTSQALSASTLTLSATSNESQIFTGTAAGQVIKLPNATTLTPGWQFTIYNQSGSATIALQNNSGTLLETLIPRSATRVFLVSASSAAGSWVQWQSYYGATSGVIHANISDITAFTTSSTSDTVITGLSTTPITGSYLVTVSGSWQCSDANAVIGVSIYNNGTAIPDSVRNYQSLGTNKSGGLHTQTITTVDGLQDLDVRVNTTAGSLTINQRSMIVMRVGS